MKRLVTPSLCFVSLLIGMYIERTIAVQGTTSPEFWDVKYIEVLQLGVGILIAVFVTYTLSNKINNNLKRREVVAGCVAGYERSLHQVYDLFCEYAARPSTELADRIIRIHRYASNNLNVMLDVLKSNNFPADGVNRELHENHYFKFKAAMTDSPFGRGTEKPNETRLSEIDTTFCAASKALIACKLAIYIHG